MSVPYRTPTGVKAVCLLSIGDALLTLLEAGSLVVDGDPLFPWPIAVGYAVLLAGQALWQLLAVHGLYLLKPRSYRWILGALKAALLFDVVGLFAGTSSGLDLALTLVVIGYMYLRRDLFVPASKR